MTDEELMLAICSGDQAAYQDVVRQHFKPISHYAFRMLGNQKDTEDITQETFLKLWINASTWRVEKAKLSTWLHRIAHNLCVDYLRKHGRVQTQDSFSEHESADEGIVDKDALTEAEKLNILDTALSQLPEGQRSAIMLCTIQNFSNKEAATIMDISVKALESTIARAKRSLREIIKTQEEKTNRVSQT